MKKRMIIMLISLAILFGLIILFKIAKSLLIAHYISEKESAVPTVSAMKVGYSLWQPHYQATASLRAVLGVDVTSEASGMVQKIYFKPGAMVQKDTPLVQLDADPDIAQLHVLQANAELAKTTYKRDKAQYAIQAISKATLDTDEANLKSTQAQVAQQQAIVIEKTVRAPFSGRLGICAVNPGQYLHPGDKVTSLQTLDPIYADFYVPQAELPQLHTGQAVTLTTDTYPKQNFTGKITTIDSSVNSNTRNIEIEATIANPKEQLVPGMFASVIVNTGTPQRYLTLPQTAITFNSYGEIIYILTPAGKDKKGNALFKATQAFVTTGETRGDQITLLQGAKEGDFVVTSGQLKLKNGSVVTVNNTVQPSNNPNPVLTDE